MISEPVVSVLTPFPTERLCDDLAALIPTLVKPVVDISWFSWQLWRLTGQRGMAILYLYTALGWGCLRCAVTAGELERGRSMI